MGRIRLWEDSIEFESSLITRFTEKWWWQGAWSIWRFNLDLRKVAKVENSDLEMAADWILQKKTKMSRWKAVVMDEGLVEGTEVVEGIEGGWRQGGERWLKSERCSQRKLRSKSQGAVVGSTDLMQRREDKWRSRDPIARIQEGSTKNEVVLHLNRCSRGK